MRLVNLTPHDFALVDHEGTVTLTVPSSGIARVAQTVKQVGELIIDGVTVPISQTTYSRQDVTGLPDPAPDVVYVVSVLTAQAVSGRDDVYVPGELVRDAAGQPVGARGLARI